MLNDKLINLLDKRESLELTFTGNEQFNFGDVVLAKRYEKSRDKKKLPVGHREGAYLVLNSLNEGLLALYGTSSFPARENEEDYFCLSSKDSGLEKDYYFFYNRGAILKEYMIKGKMYSLNGENLDIIKKHVLEVIENEKLIRNINKELDRYPLLPGDIFVEDGVNYLYLDDKDDTNIWIIPLNNKGDISFIYQGNEGFINPKDLRVAVKRDEYHRLGFIHGTQLDNVMKIVKIPEVVKTYVENDKRVTNKVNKLRQQQKKRKLRVSFDDEEMTKIDCIGLIVRYQEDGREYIILDRNTDFVIMLDKEKYINGEFYLQAARGDMIKKVGYLSTKSLIEVLGSLQGKYSSYLANGYAYSLKKVFENN